jgi:hypothetical protein
MKRPEVIKVLGEGLIVINWFSGHKRALFMLLQEQQKKNDTRPVDTPASRLKRFVRGNTTRWGTHAMSTRRLLELKPVLLDLVNHHADALRDTGGDDDDAQAAADKAIALIESPRNAFWTGIVR